MQSFLQYRNFRKAVQEQIERDKGNTRGRQQHRNAEDEPSASSSSTEDEKVDESKAESDAQEEKPKEEEEEQEDVVAEEEEDPDDYELGQLRTTRSQSTTRSTGTALGQTLTGIEVRKRNTNEGGEGKVFVVNYESDDDPLNPHNWSYWIRVRCTFTIAAIGFVVGFGSAIDSPAIPQASAALHVSEVVESMATGLFLVGFGAGALFAGPFSETFGRNPVYIVTLGLFMCFILGSALAPNITAQLIFRFLAGFFGSTPLTCAGGSISDLWDPLQRVYMFPVFANAAFTGPLMGPVIGGFIAESTAVSWRWVEWTTLLFSAVVMIVILLLQPETFPPVLLKWKAQHLRELTGDQRYKASLEIREETLFVRVRRALYRPFLLTFQEPIVILVALYLTVIYIVLFGFLDGFTFIFEDTYKLSQGVTGLCFLAIIVGLFGASALVPLIYKWAKRDLEKIQQEGGDKLPPEFRLWFSMLGGAFAIPISLYWMAWTARPDISIWSPLLAAVLFGYGTLCVFITCYQYIIDSYEMYAASALASVTLIRYIASGAMTIGAIPWFKAEGFPYVLTILASVSAALVPVPYVFYKYGHKIRAKSRYAVS